MVELSRMCLVCNPRKVDTASALARMTIVNDNAGTVGGGAGYHLENAGSCVGWKYLREFTVSAQVAALVYCLSHLSGQLVFHMF